MRMTGWDRRRTEPRRRAVPSGTPFPREGEDDGRTMEAVCPRRGRRGGGRRPSEAVDLQNVAVFVLPLDGIDRHRATAVVCAPGHRPLARHAE